MPKYTYVPIQHVNMNIYDVCYHTLLFSSIFSSPFAVYTSTSPPLFDFFFYISINECSFFLDEETQLFITLFRSFSSPPPRYLSHYFSILRLSLLLHTNIIYIPYTCACECGCMSESINTYCVHIRSYIYTIYIFNEYLVPFIKRTSLPVFSGISRANVNK